VAGRPAIGAVFLREARRSARRWQTYGLRFGMAAVLFALLFFMAGVNNPSIDPAKSGEFGRTLFLIYASTQMGIAAVLAPLLVGLGVAEEREEGTLQLLIITQLSTFQILWGKVGSRLLILASFILGSLPVLALIATFGGVGIGEVLNVTVNTLLVCVVLGTVGGVAAMFSGGGAAALGAALLWAVVSWGILPFLYFGFTGNRSDPALHMALLSPPFAMFRVGARGFAPLFTNLPAVLFVARLVTPLFSLVTSRSAPDLDAPIGDDPELLVVSRHQRRVGVMALLVPLFVAASIAIFTYAMSHQNSSMYGYGVQGKPSSAVTWKPVDTAFRQAGQFFDTGLSNGLVLGTAVLIMTLFAGFIALAQLRITGILKQAFGGGTGTGMVATVLRTYDTAVRPIRLPVWWNPVVWREVMTRGLGGPAVFARWMLLPFIGIATFAICMGAVAHSSEFLWVVGLFLWFVAMVVTLLVATTSMTTERQARTLTQLMATTHSGISVVLGKVLAVTLMTLPWMLVAIVVTGLGYVSPDSATAYSYSYAPPNCTFPTIAAYSPAYDAFSFTIWALALWFLTVTLSLAVTMRARPARLAFGILISVAFITPVALLMLTETTGIPWVFTEGLMPIFKDPSRYNTCHGNWMSVVSATFLTVAALVPLVVLLVRFRAWVLTDT
jgi:ABC-type transport system involved in multi-copper enzyme maturation permease subunit